MAKQSEVDRLEKRLKVLQNQKARYLNGKVALTRLEVEGLYAELALLPDQIESACSHVETFESIENWTDTGYGPDIGYEEYILRCKRCNKNLGQIRPGAKAGTRSIQNTLGVR